MSEIKLGLIGCGNLGRTHAECVAKIDGARFVSFVDVVEDKAKEKCEKFGGDKFGTDPKLVFDDDQIDAVYICTLHDSHAPLAIAAAEAGKHIMIEKPLALTIEDCEAIDAAVKKTGVELMPAFKLRYYPLINKAHEFIPEPQVIVGQVMDPPWNPNGWSQDPVTGGANVHSQGCHTTDILRYLAGCEPRRVWAVGGAMTHPGHPCIDQCVASILFENGHVASWIQGDAGAADYTGKFFFELFADGKCVTLHNRVKSAVFRDGKETWTEERDEEEGFQLENEEFIAALKEGRPPRQNALDGLQATRIVLAADKAIRTGEIQEL